ncbi:serine hydrolase [Enterococcus alishanensis]|uniref:Class A beta-lactamase-related serine hydrolase n=1 Tax=Enterococcus alishanensis TaxID=1303817 RepID=A0ABS6TH41_9ENTE|nr:serine hydrolase [Enterococcus alishanensis]MBV7392211.1 class A beta-lactamase-related serine hydrolase [Enterococcus alishanensis]
MKWLTTSAVIITSIFWYFIQLQPDSSQASDTKTLKVTVNDTSDFIKKTPTTEEKQFYQTMQTTLENQAQQIDGEIAVTYLDLATGQETSINGEQTFVAASTTKVPLVMLISDQIAAGNLSWEQEIPYQEAFFESGTGTIQNDIQPAYTVEELTELVITVSDNIAKNMLYDLVGGYETGVKDWYVTYLKRLSNGENTISSADMAKLLAILNAHAADNQGYQNLIKDMQQTIFNERLATENTVNQVAHKIGTNDTYVHDVGIFYGEHPYILTVYTNQVTDAEMVISTISDAVWQTQMNYPKQKD